MTSSLRSQKKLLLVGWDSADWKIIRPLIARGEMPMLAKLLRSGVGGNLATIEPVLSPMLWTSIATGKRAYDHGVHGFTEVDPATGRVTAVSAATRTARTLWEILADQGLKSHVVGWFATHGEQTPGVNVVSNLYPHPPAGMGDPADWPPASAGTYFPAALAKELDPLRFHPAELDRNLRDFFVPQADKIDQARDPRLIHLARYLAEAVSVQAAATWLMEHEPWNLTAVYFRAIDEISHLFMPFHPPKLDGVSPEDFEFYREVVNSTYRLHDLFLTRLIALAGDDAAVVVVSDHGFHSDHLRPAITPNVPAGIVVWHRQQGIFAASGPGFAVGEDVRGASLLDVTPTILRWFELPRGSDMAGRVLHDVFEGEPWAEEISTWEKPADPAAPKGARAAPDEDENRALLEQFAALGYIEASAFDSPTAAETTRRENRWQLAQAFMDGGRPDEALPLFEEVFAAMPERVDYAQRLAHCQMVLGLLDEAEATMDAALENFPSPTAGWMMRAALRQRRGDYPEALRLLEAARAEHPDDLRVWEQLGLVHLRLRHWDEAEAAARRVLEKNPEHVAAWLGISRCQLRRQESAAAVESALRALALDYNNAVAHFNLGLALCQAGKWAESAQALRNATGLSPGLIPPYRFLAHALHQLGQRAEAAALLERARGLRRVHGFQQQQALARHRDQAAKRAAGRRAARQRERETAAAAPVAPPPAGPLELVIVSGLPRSGTSLMMQMLAAGGLPPLTDGRRVADESNLEGYYEWEPIKQLPANPRLIEQAEGRAVKVISALLGKLPVAHRYRIIFMRRPVAEVVRSQQRMIERAGGEPARDAGYLERTQAEHVERTLFLLKRMEQIQVLEVDYPALVAAPLEGARRIVEFLGPTHLPAADPSTMAAVVRPTLHRQRSR